MVDQGKLVPGNYLGMRCMFDDFTWLHMHAVWYSEQLPRATMHRGKLKLPHFDTVSNRRKFETMYKTPLSMAYLQNVTGHQAVAHVKNR